MTRTHTGITDMCESNDEECYKVCRVLSAAEKQRISVRGQGKTKKKKETQTKMTTFLLFYDNRLGAETSWSRGSSWGAESGKVNTEVRKS